MRAAAMASATGTNGIEAVPGPHPSFIEVAKAYIFDAQISNTLTDAGISESRDEGIRLQGIAWIDNVRKAMHLPVRTYNTASVYYHKFRMLHPEANGFIDAAAAALFTACKIEDTLKKSREILCASYNLKSSSEQLTPDDPIFEQHSKTIIGLERLMLEASGFDFRNRYPQKLLLKLAHFYHVDKATVGKTAYDMSLDLYRTFAPLKQTAATMAVSCVELAARLHDSNLTELEGGKGYRKLRISRSEVMETVLDLLDLYTHHRNTTLVGPSFPLDKYISVRITLNHEATANSLPRHTEPKKGPLTNGNSSNGSSKSHHRSNSSKKLSPASPSDVAMTDATPTSNVSPQTTNGTGGAAQGKHGVRDGTVRFMLDPQQARQERDAVNDFFKVEAVVYEVEVPVERMGGERERERNGGRDGDRERDRRRP